MLFGLLLRGPCDPKCLRNSLIAQRKKIINTYAHRRILASLFLLHAIVIKWTIHRSIACLVPIIKFVCAWICAVFVVVAFCIQNRTHFCEQYKNNTRGISHQLSIIGLMCQGANEFGVWVKCVRAHVFSILLLFALFSSKCIMLIVTNAHHGKAEMRRRRWRRKKNN